jgi:hypothetical protein
VGRGECSYEIMAYRVPRGLASSKAMAVFPQQGEGRLHPAECATTARSKRTVQAPGRSTLLLGRFRCHGDPVITLRRDVRPWMRARPADATQVAPHRRSVHAEVGRRQGETGAAVEGSGEVGGLHKER